MLKKSGQLWLLFALCLLLIVPAMSWLTLTAMRLDNELQEDRRQTELARQEAEVQEKITSALYRMDWKIGPHVAREVARPYYLYRSFYSNALNQAGTDPFSDVEIPSPLLSETSEFVKIHFQIDSSNKFTSPQRPDSEALCEKAILCCGITEAKLSDRELQLSAAQQLASFELLDSKLRSFAVLEQEIWAQEAGNVYQQPQLAPQLNKLLNQSMSEANGGGGQGGGAAPNSPAQKQQANQKSKSQVQKMRGQGRGGKEFVKRQQAYNVNTQEWADNNRKFSPQQKAPQQQIIQKLAGSAADSPVTEGIMRPVWIGDELLLVRRVALNNQSVFQCCWLAWPKIQDALRTEVADILPEVSFLPITNDGILDPARALVTLPVQLQIEPSSLYANSTMSSYDSTVDSASGIRFAIYLAWAGLFVSALATAFLLRGLVQLNERRATFVSAVTHELRTPLTTFKMYSEMLANKMVPPDKQVQYAETLQQQADRLCHLVENVLQYARLERGPKNELQISTVDDLIAGLEERLSQRAGEARMKLNFDIDAETRMATVRIEPHVIEQVLFNLVDNASKYANTSERHSINVEGRVRAGQLEFSVRDFGPGIDKQLAKRLFHPFRKSDLDAANSAPGVGLGLALCQRMAKSARGKIRFENCEPGSRFILTIPKSKGTD